MDKPTFKVLNVVKVDRLISGTLIEAEVEQLGVIRAICNEHGAWQFKARRTLSAAQKREVDANLTAALPEVARG